MTDISNRRMHVNGTREQVATSNPANNPSGLRIASLQRRRAKGFDDFPGNPRDEARRDVTRGHRARRGRGRPPGPPGPP